MLFTEGSTKMTIHGQGYCRDGFYAGWDGKGTASQEECNALCLSESQCKYAAWWSHQTCSRYQDSNCILNGDVNHVTFAKTNGGNLAFLEKCHPIIIAKIVFKLYYVFT